MEKIVGICGSTRKGSFNKVLLRTALEHLERAGYLVEFVDLKDYPLPLFDADYEKENGLPEAVMKLKEILNSTNQIILSSPEYNSGVSGVLKNFIDWCSRKVDENEKALSCFRGKKAFIMSTSTGKLGGLRGLYCLRDILENIKVSVIPEFLTFPKANDLFLEGMFVSEPDREKLFKVLDRHFVKV